MSTNGATSTRLLHLLGASSAASFAIYSIISWPLAGSLSAIGAPAQARFFANLATTDWLPQWMAEQIVSGGLFQNDYAFLVGYCAPLIWQTLALFLALLIVRQAPVDDLKRNVGVVFGWAVAFAVISLFAFNVLTQDLWFSVVWGRMSVDGVDVYTVPFSDQYAVGLPLDKEPIAMTYGPLWALMSFAITWLSGGSIALVWLLNKLVLLGAWLCVLLFTKKIGAIRGPRAQIIALLITGWLPLGVHLSVAEGHNDVVMVAFALLWTLVLLTSGTMSTLPLLLSSLVKYVTLPMALIDVLYRLRNGVHLRTYAVQAIPTLVIGILVATYMLTDGRLASMRDMQSWRFLEPADVLALVSYVAGIEVPYRSRIFQVVFGMYALWALYRLWLSPSHRSVFLAQLAIMGAITFSVVGHVWPWFLLWTLPFAAQAPRHWLSAFVVTVAALAPFSVVHWWRFELQSEDALYRNLLVSGVIYGTAALAGLIAYFRWRHLAKDAKPAQFMSAAGG